MSNASIDTIEVPDAEIKLKQNKENELRLINNYFYVRTLFYYRFKNVLDPAIALVLIIILSPVLLLTALAILVLEGRPIFYSQRRTGLDGKDFFIVKFRTMFVDAEKQKPMWCAKNDDRISPLGKILRRTHLDELPQLWNVLKGELRLIGPRPERPEFYALLKKEIPLFDSRTRVHPGITGLAQVCQGYASSIEESREKLKYDLIYIEKFSFKTDLLIFWKTFALFVSDIWACIAPEKQEPAAEAIIEEKIADIG